jgi:hypothetical protein
MGAGYRVKGTDENKRNRERGGREKDGKERRSGE